MEIYECLSVRKTRSDTSICVKKLRNLCWDEEKFITQTSDLAVFGRRTLEYPHDWEDIIDEILCESSTDESDEEFEDFIKIFQREEILVRKSVSFDGSLRKNSLHLPVTGSSSNIGSQNSFVRKNIPGRFSSTELFGMMNCRSNSGSSRNAYARLQPCDFYIKHKIPKREPKSYGYVKCVSQYPDNQSKYRANRYRSLSPNLPKLPYLEKPPQYSNSPQIFPQRKTRIQFKNRSSKNNPPKPIKNVSKKSIPDHALMRSLLSGLSIFDNEDEVSQCYSKNLHKHKSMGNIKSSSLGSYQLKEGCCKSNVDIRDSAFENSDDACGNFKGSYDNRKRQGYLKVDQRHNCCCADARGGFRMMGPNGTCVECRGDNEYRKHMIMGNRQQRRSTLVERRRNFFENREKQVELESIKMRPTGLVINCVEKRIQNDLGKNDEITEIYRNFRSVQSTSTLSKRSSSLPPVSRFRRCNAMNSDLFNPDYNFCCDNNNSGNGLFRNSIIETIRSKVFQTGNAPKSDCNDNWTSDPPLYAPKFPKETRTAMSIILSNKNSSISCRLCREKFRKKQLSSIETQTSPQISQHQIVPDSNVDISKLPCPKNLLCDRGLHEGKCEESVRRRLKTVCGERCVCREKVLLECGDGLPWPGQAVRSREEDCLYCENAPEEFLGMIRPDLDTSEENVHCAVIESPLPQTSVTMNGLNGHTNGDLNGCGDIITQNQQRGCWTIGLINSKYKYLTAETFGFKINANGASLKKKQIWTLEPDTSSGNDTCVYLKSHLDKYLAVDSFGNVTCENEEKEPGSKFQVVVAEDNTGRWAFRNVVRGYFLGSSSDKLTCTAKAPGDSEYWHIHLAARPQVNLRSVGRKRFAHLSENLDEIHVDANIPWGEDTLFTLEFHADEDGKYALHTCNNKYLSNGGKLVDACNKDCLFAAEYHSGQLALRDRNGQYLSPIGSKAMLKTRSNTVTKDELFSLEDSLPQASFVAALNARYVSVKQGVDVTANQDEISDHEMFQLEFDWSTKRWYIRTMQDKYWTLETGGGIQASGDKRSSNALFDLVWQGDGSLAFRANNGRYVMTKRSGHLYATSDVIDENCKYYFYLINRPILVLKCEQGFVGYRAAGNPKLECNKATYECIQVERSEKGVIYFKGQNGKYWHVDSEGVTADTDTPEGFYLELREPTRLCIKSTNGNYLTASKNGLFRLGDSNFENATQWEY